MIDWRKRHEDKIRAEQRAIIAREVSQEQFVSGSKAKRWPSNSMFYATLGVVAGPPNSAKEAS